MCLISLATGFRVIFLCLSKGNILTAKYRVISLLRKFFYWLDIEQKPKCSTEVPAICYIKMLHFWMICFCLTKQITRIQRERERNCWYNFINPFHIETLINLKINIGSSTSLRQMYYYNNNNEKAVTQKVTRIIIIIIYNYKSSLVDWRNFWHNTKRGYERSGK